MLDNAQLTASPISNPRPLAARHETDSATIDPLLQMIFGGEDDGRQTSWQDHAVCAQTDPDAFFPEKGCSTAEGKKVCRGCPVMAECLEYALEHDERFGIWGGLSERERRRLKRGIA